MSDHKPTDYTCPRCGAAPSERCHAPGVPDAPIWGFHDERHDLAKWANDLPQATEET